MLQVASECALAAVEAGLRRAAHIQQISVLREDAFSCSLCVPDLYAALLAADLRMSAFLPCRISAYAQGARVVLEAMSPLDACRLLDREDLVPLAAPLEDLLRRVMREAAAPRSARATAAAAGAGRGSLGATEEQMSVRGAIPQRIDCRGTKVEELGGTGEHDAQGG